MKPRLILFICLVAFLPLACSPKSDTGNATKKKTENVTTPPKNILDDLRSGKPVLHEHISACFKVVQNLTSEDVHGLVDSSVNWVTLRDNPQKALGRYVRISGEILRVDVRPCDKKLQFGEKIYLCTIEGKINGDEDKHIFFAFLVEPPAQVSIFNDFYPEVKRPRVLFEGMLISSQEGKDLIVTLLADLSRSEKNIPLLIGRCLTPAP